MAAAIATAQRTLAARRAGKSPMTEADLMAEVEEAAAAQRARIVADGGIAPLQTAGNAGGRDHSACAGYNEQAEDYGG